MSRTAKRGPGAVAKICAALLSLACAPGVEVGSPSDSGFPLAYFHSDCAPWDGPALSIVLSHEALESPFEAPFPNLRVTSYRPPGDLAGGSFRWTGDAQNLGHAVLCESAEACRSPTAVQVRFDRAQPAGDRLTGEVYLDFGEGLVVSGPFDAVRLGFAALCG